MLLKKNLIANYIGQAWAAIMGLAFIPLYVAKMGIEAYAMVGIFTILLAWMGIADFGLTPTVNREMARANAGAHSAQSIRNLLRTFELICAVIAITIITVMWASASYIVGDWLKPGKLTTLQLTSALHIMAIALAFRWLEQFYRAILLGLQDAIWLNSTWALLSTIRWGGACLAIYIISPSLIIFFSTQAIASLIGIVLLARRSYHLLPKSPEKGTFQWKSIQGVMNFSGGMFIGSVLAFLLTNTDKLVVIKTLPLVQFGYYTIATTLAGSLLQFVIPMNNVMYPQFTELIVKKDYDELNKIYLRSTEILAIVLVPAGLVFVFLAQSVLLAWTNDARLAYEAAPILSVLALGTLFNGLMNLPYMLQLAHGWIRLSIYINIFAIAIILPTLLMITPLYGALGAAFCWLIVNFLYILLNAHLMHRKILKNAKWIWYKRSVIIPILFGSIPLVFGRLSQSLIVTQIGSAILVMICYLLSGLTLFVIFRKQLL